MFWIKKLTLSALIGASAIAALPAEADARDRHHRHGHYSHRDYDRYRDHRRDYRRDYYRDRRDYRPRYHFRRGSGTTGLIVGGAAGALLGRQVAPLCSASRRGRVCPYVSISGVAVSLKNKKKS